MNNKILSIVMIGFLLMFVAATPSNIVNENNNAEEIRQKFAEGERLNAAERMVVNEAVRDAFSNRSIVRNETVGLTRAQIHVDNEIAATRIRLALEQRTELENLDNIQIATVDDTAIIKGETKARFLGLFNVDREVTFIVEDDEIVRVRGNFDWFYRFNEDIRGVANV